MRILSIDVGIKNLGTCIIDTDVLHSSNISDAIKFWSVLTLENNTVSSLKKELNNLTFDFCLIEKQPSRNIKMRTIEGMIHMYCSVKEISFKSYSAKYKLSNQVGNFKGKKNYSERKKQSIRVVSKIIEDQPEWKQMFQTHKKKDDLADSLLQVLHYCNFEIPVLEQSCVAKEKVVSYNARKPTERQERYGYSKNNIKHFLLHMNEEELLQSSKITKAITKHFSNIETAKNSLL